MPLSIVYSFFIKLKKCYTRSSVKVSSAQGPRNAGSRGAEGAGDMIHYQHEEITREIILSAIQIHKILGPGLLESAYKTCLLLELRERGLNCKQELIFPI